MKTPAQEIREYEEMAKTAEDPALAASARRVLERLRKQHAMPTADDLVKALTMRRYAASDDVNLRLAGVAWLSERGLPITLPAFKASKTAERVSKRLDVVRERGQREAWTKGRLQAEVLKVLDAEFPTSKSTRRTR